MDSGMQHRFFRVLTLVQARATCHVVVRCEEHSGREAVVAEKVAAEAMGMPDGDDTFDDAEIVVVVLSECPAQAAEWVLVDLAVAAGGTVVVEVGQCPTAAAKFEALARLTAGRVRAGSVASERQIVATLRVSQPPMTRRGILARRAPEPVVVHASDDPRARLVDSLRALGGDQVEGRAPALELDASGCIACGVCVKACPHDALELGTAGGRTALVQYPDRCQGERDCVVACPSQVISIVGHHDWGSVLAGRPLPLARLSTSTCQKCRSLIPQGTTLCAACAARADDPFGVHLPDHLRDRLPAKWRDRLG